MPHRPPLLPLFSLGSVLFPGLMMPLHVFEERHLRLVADTLGRPADDPRVFGAVGIELGHEVGTAPRPPADGPIPIAGHGRHSAPADRENSRLPVKYREVQYAVHNTEE